jgi:hypothetical protein
LLRGNYRVNFKGHIGAYTILAGYDSKGPHLVEVTATGFTTYVPFVSMGSGSLNAYSILENRYKDNMTLAEARQLAIDAIKAGIIYDNGSGSNVDVAEITTKGVKYHRNLELVGQKIELQGTYSFKPNNIERLAVKNIDFKRKKGDSDENRIQEESVSRDEGSKAIQIES